MAAWRRKALELFPELRGDLNPVRREYREDCHLLFFDVFDMYAEAMRSADEPALRKIFDFAEWCLHQGRRAPELGNAAMTYFHQRVFDVSRRDWSDVARRLSPDVVRECRPLWKLRYSAADIQRIEEILDRAEKRRL